MHRNAVVTQRIVDIVTTYFKRMLFGCRKTKIGRMRPFGRLVECVAILGEDVVKQAAQKICPFCSKTFGTSRGLAQHISVMHRAELSNITKIYVDKCYNICDHIHRTYHFYKKIDVDKRIAELCGIET